MLFQGNEVRYRQKVFDQRGVIWVQTDMSPSSLLKGDHVPYGNNQMLAVDPITREANRFLTGPRGCEITGTSMVPDGRPRSGTVAVRRVDGAVVGT